MSDDWPDQWPLSKEMKKIKLTKLNNNGHSGNRIRKNQINFCFFVVVEG